MTITYAILAGAVLLAIASVVSAHRDQTRAFNEILSQPEPDYRASTHWYEFNDIDLPIGLRDEIGCLVDSYSLVIAHDMEMQLALVREILETVKRYESIL